MSAHARERGKGTFGNACMLWSLCVCVGIIRVFDRRCKEVFCEKHRAAEAHQCTFDHTLALRARSAEEVPPLDTHFLS